jgi:hypothetical protein
VQYSCSVTSANPSAQQKTSANHLCLSWATSKLIKA